jgi:PAS domain S-box-containing protein
MATESATPHSPSSHWAEPFAYQGAGGAVRRIRASMYLAFLVLALAVMVQATQTLGLEEVRMTDAELLDRAGEQRTLAEQLGRHASLLVHEVLQAPEPVHAEQLSMQLRHYASRALQLEELLGDLHSRSQREASDVLTAVQRWQAARERLWYRGELLVQKLAEPDASRLREGLMALQAEVVPVGLAAQAMLGHLREAAERRAARARNEMVWGLAALLVLLGVLSLAVVEPAASAVERHVQRQKRQAAVVKRLALVAEHTSALVLITDREDRVEWANKAFTQGLGWALEEVCGRRPREFMHSPDVDPAVLARLKEALARGEGFRQVWLNRTRSGEELWLDVDLCPLPDSDGQITGYISLSTDVTAQRLLQEQLSLSACTDALTQLPNRSAVMDRLHQAIAHAARHPGYGFAVLYMDFDRFKQINDTLGHAAGDDLLRQVARRLQLALRPGDALARLEPLDGHCGDVAARIGGDEFVVVLDGVNSMDCVGAIADRLLQELSEPYLIGCTPLHTSASIGIVLHQGVQAIGSTAWTAEDVLRNADTAMYEAKRGGRARWVKFDDSMHERVVRALEMEQDLRRALKEDELYVVYQPVIELAARTLVGVEALVRWRHPHKGLVSPGEFIGVAEEAGLIDAVGAVVLHKACAQFVQWQQTLGERAPPMLAVNLSRAQLKRKGVVDELRDLLHRTAMRPECLQLEVTESLAAQDEPVQATLRQIKALGVKLALDDFGTGYSSLACLHQLPVDTVKIDRSFVQHAQTVEYHRVLIEATIRVARTLGMTTVAEGIETEGQASLMAQLLCDRGQGYLFSRPLEALALEQSLLNSAPRTEVALPA